MVHILQNWDVVLARTSIKFDLSHLDTLIIPLQYQEDASYEVVQAYCNKSLLLHHNTTTILPIYADNWISSDA